MYFLMPALPVLPMMMLYLLAALLPAVYLMRYVWQHDTVESEPPGLLVLLIFAGVLAAVASGYTEGFLQTLLSRMGMYALPRTLYMIVFAFVIVAAVEEGFKFLFLRLLTWKHPAFDYRFDALVYAAFVSLGFAAFENVQYIFSYGLSLAIPRAVLSIPGHLSFSVFMGIFYGRAKMCSVRNYHIATALNLWGAWASAVLLHGIYDTCAMLGTPVAMIVFMIFVLAMFAAAFRALKHISAADAPV